MMVKDGKRLPYKKKKRVVVHGFTMFYLFIYQIITPGNLGVLGASHSCHTLRWPVKKAGPEKLWYV